MTPSIEPATRTDMASAICDIHMTCLPAAVSDFSLLGRRTVQTFYQNVIARNTGAILTVAASDGGIGGFVLVTKDIRSLFPQTLLRTKADIVRFVLQSSFRGTIRALWLKISSGTTTVGNVPELVYLAVSPGCRGLGFGRALIAAAEEWFACNEVDYYELNVHDSNRAALQLYLAAGMRVARTYVKDGIEMHTLHKHISNRNQ